MHPVPLGKEILEIKNDWDLISIVERDTLYTTVFKYTSPV